MHQQVLTVQLKQPSMLQNMSLRYWKLFQAKVLLTDSRSSLCGLGNLIVPSYLWDFYNLGGPQRSDRLKWSDFTHEQYWAQWSFSPPWTTFFLVGASFSWFSFLTASFLSVSLQFLYISQPTKYGHSPELCTGEVFNLPLHRLSPPPSSPTDSLPWEADLCRLRHGLQCLLWAELCVPQQIHMSKP